MRQSQETIFYWSNRHNDLKLFKVISPCVNAALPARFSRFERSLEVSFFSFLFFRDVSTAAWMALMSSKRVPFKEVLSFRNKKSRPGSHLGCREGVVSLQPRFEWGRNSRRRQSGLARCYDGASIGQRLLVSSIWRFCAIFRALFCRKRRWRIVLEVQTPCVPPQLYRKRRSALFSPWTLTFSLSWDGETPKCATPNFVALF